MSTDLSSACFWWQDLEPQTLLKDLQDDSADVVIIGAGFTGLWTAYFLKQQKPDWRITIVEQYDSGYGASGRNGGWLIGGLAGQDYWLRVLSPAQRTQAQQLLFDIVPSVQSICHQHNIDCDLDRQGVLYAAARYPEQGVQLNHWYQTMTAAGYCESAFQLLSSGEAEQYVCLPELTGALYSPHCATLNPAKLIQGLTTLLMNQGVQIYGSAKVTQLQPGLVSVNNQHRLTCEYIVVATEAFPELYRPLMRKRLPVFSNIVATRPLPDTAWEQMIRVPGLAVSDLCRSVTYGQRSQSGRLIFGARGGYRFGGKAQFDFAQNDPTFRTPATFMQRLFPSLSPQDIEFRWAGSLAMTRNQRAFVGMDRATRIGFAGGYGGEGVGASHLFGKTLAGLIGNESSIYTEQPWVVKGDLAKLIDWESEPLPWLGYQVIQRIYALEDWLCHHRPERWLQNPVNRLSRLAERLMH